MIPATGDSMSVCTLSVSMTYSSVPTSTVSPSSTSHSLNVPSVIAMPSFGILMATAMSAHRLADRRLDIGRLVEVFVFQHLRERHRGVSGGDPTGGGAQFAVQFLGDAGRHLGADP